MGASKVNNDDATLLRTTLILEGEAAKQFKASAKKSDRSIRSEARLRMRDSLLQFKTVTATNLNRKDDLDLNADEEERLSLTLELVGHSAALFEKSVKKSGRSIRVEAKLRMQHHLKLYECVAAVGYRFKRDRD